MKCPKCGYLLPEDSVFCQYCGVNIAAEERVQTELAASAIPESAKEAAPQNSFSDQHDSDSLFMLTYNSYISETPTGRQLFNALLGSEALKTAYLEECEKQAKLHEAGIRINYKDSYLEFMSVLRKEYIPAIKQAADPIVATAPNVMQPQPAQSKSKNRPRTMFFCTIAIVFFLIVTFSLPIRQAVTDNTSRYDAHIIGLSEYDLAIGATRHLACKTNPESLKTQVLWKSSAPYIARISKSGTLVALKEGTTEISIYINNIKCDSVTVHVYSPNHENSTQMVAPPNDQGENSNTNPSASSTITYDPDLYLSVKNFYNGMVVKAPAGTAVAPLTISTKGSLKYYIVLVDKTCNGKNNMAFCVSGGQTVEKDVPLGNYEIYYATGAEWYGKDHLFGSKTNYYRCDDSFLFHVEGDSYLGWTLELYEQTNGNLDTDPISESSFPSV